MNPCFSCAISTFAVILSDDTASALAAGMNAYRWQVSKKELYAERICLTLLGLGDEEGESVS